VRLTWLFDLPHFCLHTPPHPSSPPPPSATQLREFDDARLAAGEALQLTLALARWLDRRLAAALLDCEGRDAELACLEVDGANAQQALAQKEVSLCQSHPAPYATAVSR